MRGAAELLRDDDVERPMTKAERLHFLDNIVADVVRLDALLQRLRDLAQAESSVAEGSSSVADTIYSLRERFPALNISSRGDTDISIALPPEAAGIAFANLAENALQHGATLLELRVSADARTAVILVRDDGTGRQIANASFSRSSQPAASRAVPAWASVSVRAMLSSHGGTIRLLPTTGAEFEITIPGPS
ncbi:sensor histidine kinase [Rhizobium johnstonii]|uniref:sensor histidine kinase n=1 Tax=Rhizobium johnstonii TaxID=3019933 RepID=UPI002E122CFB